VRDQIYATTVLTPGKSFLNRALGGTQAVNEGDFEAVHFYIPTFNDIQITQGFHVDNVTAIRYTAIK
jgi:hypothetical protein